jgi:transglutaminase-like putative cysteine protease
MAALHERVTYDPDPTHVSTTAKQAFELKRGVCQDFAHIMVASARHLGIPSRYVSGYLVGDGATAGQHAGHQAGHAWAEAYVEGFGWIGFDAANKLCPTETYVRLAVGLDYLGAAPVRGNRYGGGEENLTVAITVDQSSRQVQG